MIRAPLRAVTFDLDNTLWSVDDVLEVAEQALYDDLCTTYPQVAERFGPESMRCLRGELALAQPELQRNATTLRRAVLHYAAQQSGLSVAQAERFTDHAFAVFLEARQQVRPYPDVLPALQVLARRFAIGVITNGNADIYRTELAGYVDFVVRGVDLDIPKPEPEIFLHACRCAGLSPSEVLHVGDDPQTDVAGALSAGLQAALICRYGMPRIDGALCVDNVLMIDDLAALCRALVVPDREVE